MKILLKILLIGFVFSSINRISNSQIPTYTLTARNLQLISPNELSFDVYLLHINYPVEFISAGGAYIFNFNIGVANGGDLTYRLITTEIPEGTCRPWHISVNIQSGHGQLRFYTAGLCSKSGGFIVSHTGAGTLIARMALRTTASMILIDSLALTWRHYSPEIYVYTYNTAFIGNLILDITDTANHFIDFLTEISEPIYSIPTKFNLAQNYPNPFNSSTKINYELPYTSYLSIKIYDVLGNEISNLVSSVQEKGRYSVEWDANNLSSGIYYYKFEVADFINVRKMILLK